MKELYCSLCQKKKSENEYSSKEKKKMNKRVCTDCLKKENKSRKRENRKEVLQEIYARANAKQVPYIESNDEVEIKRRERERKNLTKELKQRILSRDKEICYYCEEKATTVDHKNPISRGGNSVEENLTACCEFCNNVKGHMNEKEFQMIFQNFTKKEWNYFKIKYLQKK